MSKSSSNQTRALSNEPSTVHGARLQLHNGLENGCFAFMRRALVLATIVIAQASCTGCFEQEPPTDLPPWALQKSLFTPDARWWFQRTVIDLPYDQANSFVGDGDLSEVIRWRIEEKYLIAFRAAPVITSDDPDLQGLLDVEQPIVAYPIQRHFDVIEGQIVDLPRRAWFDRGYIKVDFGSSLLTDFRFLALAGQADGVSYFESNPTDANAPIFSSSYMEWTTHTVMRPTLAVDPISREPKDCGTPEIIDFLNCAAIDLTYRTSLLRIPDNHTYEPIVTPGETIPPGWNASRFFANSILDVTVDRGILYRGRLRFLNRFNIWQSSLDENGERLPFSARRTRPVVWYLNEEWPEDLRPVVADAATEWDAALKSVVRELRAWECADEGTSIDVCRDGVDIPSVMFLVCPNNPVKAGDPRECGAAGTHARLGDMRYHMVYYSTSQTAGQDGALTWWSPDPYTGEIINAHVTIAAGTMGKTNRYLSDAVVLAAHGATALQSTNVEVDFDVEHWQDDLATASTPFPPRAPFAISGPGLTRAPLATVVGTSEGLMPPTLAFANRRELLAPIIDTTIEDTLLDPEDGWPRGSALGELDDDLDALRAASPLRRPLRQDVHEDELRAAFYEERGVDATIPFDLELSYLADEYRGQTVDEIHDDVRRETMQAFVAHEFGHALGIRHNFQASFDPLNFKPGFWQARALNPCEGPRYVCPYAVDELDARIHDYSYASIMDYMPRVVSFPDGLGYFDVAAVHALYGEFVHVFRDPGLVFNADAVALIQSLYDSGPNPVKLIYDVDFFAPNGVRPRSVHYSEYPRILGIENLVDPNAREWVPSRHLDPATNQRSTTTGKVVIPYGACDDRVVNSAAHCVRFDQGADAYEVTQHRAAWFKFFYPLNNFRLGRADWSAVEVRSQVTSRVFSPAKRWNDWLGSLRYDFATDYPELFADPSTFGPIVEATRESFNFLVSVLALPETGPHVLSTTTNGVPILVPPKSRVIPGFPVTAPVSDATIVSPEGRPYRSLFAIDGGPQLLNIGSFSEKETALETLLDPTYFNFPGRETWQQADVFMTNYHNAFPKQIVDVLGAVVADDWDRLAGGLVDGRMTYRDYTDLNSVPEGTLVRPAIGFNMRLRALVYIIGLVIDDYADRSMFDYARIFVDGTGESIEGDAVRIEFTDPISQKRFVAFSFPEAGIELGIGARLLTRANALLLGLSEPGLTDTQRQAREDDLRREVALIELVRAVVASYSGAYVEQ